MDRGLGHVRDRRKMEIQLSKIPCIDESGIGEGRIGGRDLFVLWAGWEFAGVVDTSGSNSHGETLSGRKIDDGSSH
ncbi:hypothetical protein Ahy_A04g021373 isoform C [Arachis hypogaea]|uniref:Uncharacterized protein n=1 Tax=Arachis hypogaea TaxID=3818 RepID=A0A445DK62_ARAHY|nr:hypothetical protein Ahy_A04g021373 isoform C [Arachis hypogaea]